MNELTWENGQIFYKGEVLAEINSEKRTIRFCFTYDKADFKALYKENKNLREVAILMCERFLAGPTKGKTFKLSREHSATQMGSYADLETMLNQVFKEG